MDGKEKRVYISFSISILILRRNDKRFVRQLDYYASSFLNGIRNILIVKSIFSSEQRF